MTEVPGGQPLALPEPVWQTIADINTYLQDVRTNAQKLTTQEKTLQALAQIERLNQKKWSSACYYECLSKERSAAKNIGYVRPSCKEQT